MRMLAVDIAARDTITVHNLIIALQEARATRLKSHQRSKSQVGETKGPKKEEKKGENSRERKRLCARTIREVGV